MIEEKHSLTDQQIEYFETFGLLVRRNVFSPEEMNKINQEFDRRLASIQKEADPDEERRFNNWANRNPESPYTASLLEDPRIYLPSEQLVGEDSVPVHSNAKQLSGQHPMASRQQKPSFIDSHFFKRVRTSGW